MHSNYHSPHAPPSDAGDILEQVQRDTLERSMEAQVTAFMRHTPFCGVAIDGATTAHMLAVLPPLRAHDDEAVSPWPFLALHHSGIDPDTDSHGPLVLVELTPARFNQLMGSLMGHIHADPVLRKAVLAEAIAETSKPQERKQ